jgi:hypothetical protein
LDDVSEVEPWLPVFGDLMKQVVAEQFQQVAIARLAPGGVQIVPATYRYYIQFLDIPKRASISQIQQNCVNILKQFGEKNNNVLWSFVNSSQF